MKNLLIVVFALVFALSLAGVPGAQEQNKQEQRTRKEIPRQSKPRHRRERLPEVRKRLKPKEK